MGIITAVLIITGIVAVFAGGYLVGQHNGRLDAERAENMLLRLDPPRRTGGVPTNTDAPPSEVRQTRWRNGSFRAGPDPKRPGDA